MTPALPLGVSRRRFMTALAAAGAVVTNLGRALAATDLARYVDPEGDDDADGRSPLTAWRTLDRAGGAVPPGGALLLRRGGFWRGTLAIDAGVAIVSAYGAGAPPTVSGAVPLPGLAAAGRAWVRAPLPEDPAQVFVGGVRGVRRPPDRLLRPGDWSFAEGMLTVLAGPEQAASIEVTTTRRGLDLRRAVGPLVSGLRIVHAEIGIDADTMAGGEIAGCIVAGCYGAGVRASSARLREDVTIAENEIVDIAGTGISIGGRLSGIAVRRNRLVRCATLTERAVRAAGGRDAELFAWSAGIKNWGWGEAGWQEAVDVSENVVTDCGPPPEAEPDPGQGLGIWLDEIVAPRSRATLVRNIVRHCAGRGLYVEKCDDVDVDYNLVVDCARTPRVGALALQANSYGYDALADRPARIARSARGNRFRHNTVCGGWWTLEAVAEEPGCRLDDNLFQGNILVSSPTAGAWLELRGGGANAPSNGAGNRYHRNCFGRTHAAALGWDGRLCPTAAVLEAASDGAVSGSVPGDPRFDPAAPDLFALAADSPCRDAADQIVADLDVYGAPVPRGPAADLGCVETMAAGSGSISSDGMR